MGYLLLSNSWLLTATRGEPEGAGITFNRGKSFSFKRVQSPVTLCTPNLLYRQKINLQTEINTRRAFLDTIVFATVIFTKVQYTALLQITAVIINKSDTRSLLSPSQHCHKFRNSSLGCCRRFAPYSEYSIDIGLERLAQLCLKLAFLLYSFCISFAWRTMILEIVISFLSQTGTF